MMGQLVRIIDLEQIKRQPLAQKRALLPYLILLAVPVFLRSAFPKFRYKHVFISLFIYE